MTCAFIGGGLRSLPLFMEDFWSFISWRSDKQGFRGPAAVRMWLPNDVDPVIFNNVLASAAPDVSIDIQDGACPWRLSQAPGFRCATPLTLSSYCTSGDCIEVVITGPSYPMRHLFEQAGLPRVQEDGVWKHRSGALTLTSSKTKAIIDDLKGAIRGVYYKTNFVGLSDAWQKAVQTLLPEIWKWTAWTLTVPGTALTYSWGLWSWQCSFERKPGIGLIYSRGLGSWQWPFERKLGIGLIYSRGLHSWQGPFERKPGSGLIYSRGLHYWEGPFERRKSAIAVRMTSLQIVSNTCFFEELKMKMIKPNMPSLELQEQVVRLYIYLPGFFIQTRFWPFPPVSGGFPKAGEVDGRGVKSTSLKKPLGTEWTWGRQR